MIMKIQRASVVESWH